MLPEPNKAMSDLDTLSSTVLTTSSSSSSSNGLVGVQVFGSTSVMDDMALAAVWLSVATGTCKHATRGLSSLRHAPS